MSFGKELNNEKPAKRKMISVLLAVVLLLCAAFPVSAQTTSETPSSATQLTDEDLLIPEDVAEYIAEYFVDDMAATGMTVWDENTAITDCVTTYDENRRGHHKLHL